MPSGAKNKAAMELHRPVATLREQWLEGRRHSIGASEVPTVLGLNPFDTPLQLALRKRGDIPDKEETEAMRMGHKLEPVVAELYCEETGRVVTNPGDYEIWRHPDHTFLHATLDRLVRQTAEPNSIGGVLQLKTVGAHMGHHWEEAVPLYVQAQVQAEMAVADRAWGSVAALIGGQRFLWKDIERNDDFITYMVAKVDLFWAMIQKGDLPEAGAADNQALRLLYPQHDQGKTIELSYQGHDLDLELDLVKGELARYTERKNKAEATIKQMMGDAEYGILPDGGRYSWKTSERKGYTVEPTTTRTLRRLKA